MDSSRTPDHSLPRTARLAFVALLVMTTTVTVTTTLPVQASPDTWVVSTHDDDADVSSVGCPAIPGTQECTLREAVRVAQQGDTIELPTGTLALHSDDGEVVIDRGLRIVGQGRTDTTIEPIDRGHRIFRITATGGEVTIEHLTLQGGGGSGVGGPGGAILANGQSPLILAHTQFSQNFSDHGDHQPGGAVAVTGTARSVTIQHSWFAGNSARRGAAIYIGDVSGTVSIDRSTFHGNLSAGGLGPSEGAAIYAFRATGGVSISGSAFDDNSVGDAGGAIAVFDSGPITIRSSTFRENSAATGGALSLASGSTTDVANSTFVDNAGGLLRTTGGNNTADLAFVTIVDHNAAFSVGDPGSDEVSLRHSALANVVGCTDVTIEGNIRDHASGPACAPSADAHPTLSLTTSIDGIHHFPQHDSPLSGHDIADCPSVDQRGVSRSGDCTVGAIDLSEITCPAGQLPRETTITCHLDVALTGSPTVTVEINPVLFDDPVSLADGRASFSFTIPGNAPDGTALVSVGGGAYSSSHPVEPAAGSGGGTGGGGSSGGNGGNPAEGPTRGDGSPAGDAADVLDVLPATGADDLLVRAASTGVMLLGLTLVGASRRRTGRVPADR